MPPGPPWDGAHASPRSRPTTPASVLRIPAHRLAQPAVQPTNLADRVGLHGAKVDVEEAVFGAAVTELHRPLHAARPLPHVQLAEVAPVEVVGETADDVGVDVGHRKQ